MTTLEKNRILLCCTGSVASLKVPEIVQKIQQLKYKVKLQVVATDHAVHFFDSAGLGILVHRDQDEWQLWKKRNDPVLHIDLRRWADILLIAPLDANTLAKMANGICDNLLTCVVRAWDCSRPLLYAPAMNTHMWDHPLTAQHTQTLHNFGYREIPCIEKTLVCGDTGMGAMAEVDTIVAEIQKTLEDVNKIR